MQRPIPAWQVMKPTWRRVQDLLLGRMSNAIAELPSGERRARKNGKNFHFRRATKQSNLLAIVGVAFTRSSLSEKEAIKLHP
jgi:hypothetical protein